RTAHAVVVHPVVEVAAAFRRGAKTVYELAHRGERRRFAAVVGALDGRLLGNDLPRLAREKPTAAPFRQEGVYDVPQAQRLVGQKIKTASLGAQEKSLLAQAAKVQFQPREIGIDTQVAADIARRGDLGLQFGPGHQLDVFLQLLDGTLG